VGGRFGRRWLVAATLVTACALPARSASPVRPAALAAPDAGPALAIGSGRAAASRASLGGLDARAVAVPRSPASPGFYHSFLAPELARHAEGHAYFVGSPVYGFLRDTSSAALFETVEGIEHDTIRAVRRATRDWLLDEAGIDRLAVTFRPVTEALDRVDARMNPGERSSTTIRIGFSSLYPRLVVDRETAAGEFRFRVTLDGRAGADYRPASRRGPWIGTDVDVAERSARFRLGVAF
jgi:hypothetical protein